MTQEDKQLLLIDICARLLYGVKFKADNEEYIREIHYIKDENVYIREYRNLSYWIDTIKPYLRSMSSMTAEEEYEYHQCKNINYLDICEMEHEEILETTALCFSHATDWLNKNMFDYRGLIEKGLALEAPEGIYKKE